MALSRETFATAELNALTAVDLTYLAKFHEQSCSPMDSVEVCRVKEDLGYCVRYRVLAHVLPAIIPDSGSDWTPEKWIVTDVWVSRDCADAWIFMNVDHASSADFLDRAFALEVYAC